MYTKQITIADNFLSGCGHTVGDMISYLSQFPADAEVVINLQGDTHGCDIESSILQNVPMSGNEIKENQRKMWQDRIKRYKDSIEYYKKNNQLHRIEECNLNDKLAEAQEALHKL